MITDIITKKEWDIPEYLRQKFNAKNLKNMLQSHNRICGGGYFFMDYFRKEIIIDSVHSRILCGYSADIIAQEGLSFLKRILTKPEFTWCQQLTQSIFDVFFTLNVRSRYNFIGLFDIPLQLMNGDEEIIHCKATPFQLCDNGNLWLLLCYLSPSLSRENHNACLIDTEKLVRYNFIDNFFVSSKISPLTHEENNLLLLMAKNMLETDICEVLDMHKSKYHRIKKNIFNKLEVTTPAGAVLRAYQLGII